MEIIPLRGTSPVIMDMNMSDLFKICFNKTKTCIPLREELSVTDGVGGQLALRYGVRGVPTMVLLDGDGEVVYARAGSPNRGEIMAAVEGLLNQ